MEAYEIKSSTRKKALLLHHSGEEVFSIYSTFENCKDLTYEETSNKLTEYFNPKKCPEYEIHKFRKCAQKEGESIDEYYTRLLALAENCEFDNKSKEVKMQIIHKCASNKLRKRALQQSMTLEEILNLERSMEISSLRAEEMSKCDARINKVEHSKPKNKEKAMSKRTCFHCGGAWPHEGQCPKAMAKRSCFRCGGAWPHEGQCPKAMDKRSCYRCGGAWPHEGQCPAMNKKCNKCGRINHFSSVCRSKNTVNATEEEENECSDAESI